MTDALLAPAFNEWMRRYTDEPERFSREFEAVVKFLAEQSKGQTPTYGDECAVYLKKIVKEMAA